MAETDFWQALSDTIRRAVNLRIVTLVGDSVVSGTLERMEVAMPATPADALITDINLVGGDITQIVSGKLLGADYADLRAAHAASVKQAQEIVARNVEIFTKLATELGDQLNQLPPPASGPVRTGASAGAQSTPSAGSG